MSEAEEGPEALGYALALCAALEHGAVGVARVLMDQKWWSMGGEALMRQAARAAAASEESTALLLSTPGDWRRVLDGSGAVALAGAAASWGAARRLCEAGEHPDDAARGNSTALWQAALRSAPKAVKMLLSHGADPRLCPLDRNVSPVCLAMGFSSPGGSAALECLALLIEASLAMPAAPGAGSELLEYAVGRGCVEAIGMLARSGVDVSGPAKRAPSMMALAIESKSEECALALAGAGWVPVDSPQGIESAGGLAQAARLKGFERAAGAIEAMVEKMVVAANLPTGSNKAGSARCL